MAEIAQGGQRYPNGETTGNYPNNPPRGRVEYPSSQYRNYDAGFLRVAVPANWQEIRDGNSLWFSPQGGYGQANGQAVFTHGVNFGVAQTQNRDLQRATDEFVNSLAQGNRGLRASGGYGRTTVSGRAGLITTLNNVNEATGQPESVTVVTTPLRNGGLFYMVAVSPQGEARTFDSAFNNILRSVRIND
jgi:hypothetical protein